MLVPKRILLAVCGGIAAYKSAELTRLLRKQGCEIRVVMTRSAMAFITPLTLQALSGNPVHIDLLDCDQEHAMGHISLARWADCIVMAPATANMIAKLSHGLADDLVSTLVLAAECPLYLAPAMNRVMWHKAVTQENIERLVSQGAQIIGPEVGSQACGEIGLGRMSEPEAIMQYLMTNAAQAVLQSKKILITAGPTREPLDPVRYITNRSSGKMAYALAQAALAMGAEVTLVSGPVALSAPDGARLIRVETAAQMHEAVMTSVQSADIFIAAAAVADYSPVSVNDKKIKKQNDEVVILLRKTRDILADVSKLTHNRPYTVGFAAETHDLERYAQDKLVRKNLDMVAANWVGKDKGGFESDLNALSVYWHGGGVDLAMTDKNQLARQLMSLIAEKINEKNTTKNSG
ncbi:MAG: bifunctional phosphopantothenoylcysteine decarboxylase/phosphopantothenate--cysteine ligase CoaBC [Methylomicrobium sp.]|nr:bifunctional phosphopantothenoylcysteine decarboxylase/phosphopantothenate--cysteine ligase CoaBC [Methylomicrobium sp.]